MIPKFRAWHESEQEMLKDIWFDWQDFENYGSLNEIFRDKRLIFMQSTGMFDSRSEPVEIYEDDIVKRTSLIPGGSDLIGVVKMLEGCWVIDDGKQAVLLWTEVDENIVLGNIYEHPELVEVE